MNKQLMVIGSASLAETKHEDLRKSKRGSFFEGDYKNVDPIFKENFDRIYLYVVVIILIALMGAFVKWYLDVRKENYENSLREEAVEVYKAELQAKREEESAARSLAMNSEANRRKDEINMLARLAESVREYHFDRKSLITFLQCPYNRVDSEDPLYPDTLYEVLHQSGQFETYSDTLQIVSDYYKIAEFVVDQRYNNDKRICSSDYVFAEFRDGEVYLKKKLNATSFSDYWQYTE